MAKIKTYQVDDEQISAVLSVKEGQFSDHKSKEIKPAKLTQTVSAFANSDGGDLYIGIHEYEEDGQKKVTWDGFTDIEEANAHLQVFEKLFPLGEDYVCNFLEAGENGGVVIHVEVQKTKKIILASNEIAYVRRGAQNLPMDTAEKLKQLEYTKGMATFESEVLSDVPMELITASDVVERFVTQVVPQTTPEAWVKKQLLLRNDHPTVAGVLLFADEPQAALPKHCGVKIYRYKTNEDEGTRDTLAFTPVTIEGPLYEQISGAVAKTTELVEQIPKVGEGELEKIQYPPETLHEIITNALIHRDYSVADDVHIRIFDNRIEVQSPGKLPAHMTIANILDERFARNGSVVRILNKFPDPPNQDVGEGLNTAFNAMHALGLKEPEISETETSVLVLIRHEQLASAEETIIKYLEENGTINNAKAREICHIPRDYRVKVIFQGMVESGIIEKVPGTNTASTAYRLIQPAKPNHSTEDRTE